MHNTVEFINYLDHIEAYLQANVCDYPSEPQQELFDSMRYSLLAGGKRLRPIFVYEFCRMCGGDWKKAAPFAAAVEMVHTYSLIHDDLPSMDNDDFRRGIPTNHKVHGEAVAILAGDALLTAAFEQLADASFDAQTRIKAVKILANCAGQVGMVGGQVLDIKSEERGCSEQEVLDIQSRKTGALIRAACVLGVLAGNGTMQQIGAATQFANHLGLAFQIRDDVLDVIGTEEEMGKGVGTDEHKNTFVRLHGIEKCEALIDSYTDKAIEALSVFEEKSLLSDLAMSLKERRT